VSFCRLETAKKPAPIGACGDGTHRPDVEDENSKARAMLAIVEDGPGLSLHDENGKITRQVP